MKVRTLIISFLLVFFVFTSVTLSEDGYGVPQRDSNNIIVASYNIKWFGQTQHDYDKLAVVIEKFDVCGILEVKKESDLSKLVDALERKTGKDWGYVFGVRTHRPDSRKTTSSNKYYEAYAAVWRKDRVQLGDGIISNVWDIEEVYRNDPFLVSFKRGNFDFILFLVHTRWSDDVDGNRENEVSMLAEHIDWMRSFLQERDIILAGDFNYDGQDEAMQKMANAGGLKQIDLNAKSTFKNDCTGYSSSYDHIYISDSDTGEFIQDQCAVLDSTKLVYGDNSTANMQSSISELSDHLPVWAAFDVTEEDDD
jgi:endonuclease/exonuclease/phosphatase family metal-dependent hydrolase